MPDLILTTIAPALLSCLSVEVAKISVPPQHVRYALGTEQVHDISTTIDLCCQGVAYVSLGQTYWSVDTFPELDMLRQTRGDCPPPAWAQLFQVGIIRCAPVGDLTAPPTDAEITAAALLNMEDAYALRRVQCCFRQWLANQVGTALDGMSIYFERQNQVNPQGGCIERYFTVTVQFPNQECGCTSP